MNFSEGGGCEETGSTMDLKGGEYLGRILCSAGYPVSTE